MKIQLFISVILLPLLTCLELSSQTTTVMTYNIRYDNPADSLNAWKNRKDNIAALIRRESPDLLGIQEALKIQMLDLDSLLPDYQSFGIGRDDGKEAGEYAGIFFKKSRFEMIEGNTIWLSETPEKPGSMGWDAACTRILTWVRLKDKQTAKLIWHFNTHFDHVGAKARDESARLIKKKIKELICNEAVILTGDFNCTLRSKPMKILQSACPYLKDCRKLSPTTKGPAFTYSTFSVNGQHEDIIDHILINSFFRVSTYSILDDSYDGSYYSDHLPVKVMLYNHPVK